MPRRPGHLLAAALLLSACLGTPGDATTTSPAASSTPGDVPGGTWRLVEGTSGGVAVPIVHTHPVTLVIDPAEPGTIGGMAGCNRYGGELAADDPGGFEVTDVISTEMACEPPAVMLAERAYLSALGTVDTWTSDGGALVLTGPDVTLRFEPEATGQVEPLGTWRFTGGGVDGQPVEAVVHHPTFLTIGEGSVTGSVCNSFGGDATVDDGGGFSVGQVGMTAMLCTDEAVMFLERVFHDALARVDTWTVDGAGFLTLLGPDVELAFEPVPPLDTAALTGVVWELTSIVTATGTSRPSGDPWVQFHGDGSFDGWTGCRDLTGTWIDLGGSRVLLTDLSVGDRTCPQDLIAQDGQVVSGVGDSFEAVLDDTAFSAVSPDVTLTFERRRP